MLYNNVNDVKDEDDFFFLILLLAPFLTFFLYIECV